jgi:hypothetical protein
MVQQLFVAFNLQKYTKKIKTRKKKLFFLDIRTNPPQQLVLRGIC